MRTKWANLSSHITKFVIVDSLFTVASIVCGVLRWYLFCIVVPNAISNFAISLLRTKEAGYRFSVFLLSSGCLSLVCLPRGTAVDIVLRSVYVCDIN